MNVFQRLQDSPFTDWLLGSESIWAYPFVLTLHTVGLAILVGASVVAHLRLLGVGRAVPPERIGQLYAYVWWGFALNLVTGLMLFATQAAKRASDPVFLVKLVSIGLALWLGQVARRDMSRPAGRLSWRPRSIATAGLLAWMVAIVAGRLMAYLGE